MPSLFSLPAWLPWWVPLVVAVPALLYALVFLLMPFSVFGLKSRMEGIEARLDEIQGEIRSLSLRLPEPGRELNGQEEAYEPPPRTRTELARPPIPPAPADPRPTPTEVRRRLVDEPARPRATDRPAAERAEPRLNWPR